MTPQLPHETGRGEAPEPGRVVLTAGHQQILVRLQAGHTAGVAGQTVGLDEVAVAEVEEESDVPGVTAEPHLLPSYLDAVDEAGHGDAGQFGLNSPVSVPCADCAVSPCVSLTS